MHSVLGGSRTLLLFFSGRVSGDSRSSWLGLAPGRGSCRQTSQFVSTLETLVLRCELQLAPGGPTGASEARSVWVPGASIAWPGQGHTGGLPRAPSPESGLSAAKGVPSWDELAWQGAPGEGCSGPRAAPRWLGSGCGPWPCCSWLSSSVTRRLISSSSSDRLPALGSLSLLGPGGGLGATLPSGAPW